MAMTVPNPYAVNVAVGSRAETGLVSAPGMTPLANDQAEQFDRNQQRFKVAMQKYQDEVDKVRVMEMSNELQDLERDLRSGENGYEKLLGKNALERPDQKSLTDEYDELYKTRADEIIKKAGNRRQRLMIENISNSMRQGIKDQTAAWTVRQFKSYSQAVFADSLGKAGEMALSDDEKTSQSGFYAVRNLVKAKAAQDGVPPDYRSAMGGLHTNKLSNVLENLGADAGRDYLKANKDEMTAAQIASAKKAIEAKRDSENIRRHAEDIIGQGLSEQEALKLTDSLKDEYKDKVRRLVKDSYDEAEQARSDRVKTLEDMVWQAYVNDQPIPTDVKEEIRDLDPKKYSQLFDGSGVFVERGKAPAVSDAGVVRQLERLYADDIESFASADLRQYAGSLSKTDLSRFTSLQTKSGDETYKSFMKELEFHMVAEGMTRASDKTEMKAAAGRMWDEAKRQKSNGAIDPASRQEMIKTLFAKKSSWSNTQGYEAILEYPQLNTAQALYTAGVYDNKDIKGKADYLLKALTKKGWKDATVEQCRAAASIASGAGWPADVLEAARQELETIKAQKRARGEAVPDEQDMRALELIMRKNVFGK